MTSSLEMAIRTEARLLDEVSLDHWLAMYTQDATYWVPMDEKADPTKASSVIFDNHSRLQMRVEQTMRQSRVAQQPPSQMLRMITNFEIVSETAETASVRYAQLLIETRAGDWRQQGLGETRLYPGRCFVDLRKGDDTWQFVRKKVVLLNRYLPLEGVSFII